MPFLHGVLVFSKDTPSFVIPVFVDRLGSNQSLIQEIDSEDRVSGFLEVDVGNSYENAGIQLEIEKGDDALWGFRSLSGELTIGKSKEIGKTLSRKLNKGECSDFPLIELQLARFCKRKVQRLSQSLIRSFELIKRGSPLAAKIWRDCVVLLPIAKKELAGRLPEHRRADIDGIRLECNGSTIDVTLPGTLADSLFSKSDANPFLETLSLGNVFGLTGLRLKSSEDEPVPTPQPEHLHEVYGEMVPFTGIGEVVAKNAPSYSRKRLLIAPWVAKKSRPPSQNPLLSFCVLNTDSETIDRASRYAQTLGRETIKIAIVTWPITFGTSTRGHKLDPVALDSLRPSFDYTFIIANHVLQKPVGFAPRLAASSRAVKYVKACVDGIMQVVWSDDGPKQTREFFSVFPRGGFCLVGRASGTKTSSPADILFEAIGSTLNERLSLHFCKRVVVIGPAFIVNDRRAIAFMNDAADLTSNEVMSIESINRRPAATILGFGITPITPNERSYREFCLELLRAKGFYVLRDLGDFVHGEFQKGSTVAIGFASTERSITHVLNGLDRSRVTKRCILTRFVPNNSLWEYGRARRILVFHYSLLDEYLSRRMSLPAIRERQ